MAALVKHVLSKVGTGMDYYTVYNVIEKSKSKRIKTCVVKIFAEILKMNLLYSSDQL